MGALNFLAKTADALVLPFIYIGLYAYFMIFSSNLFPSNFVSPASIAPLFYLPFLLLYFYRNSLNIIFCLVMSLIIFIFFSFFLLVALSMGGGNTNFISIMIIPLIIIGYFAKQVFLPTSSGRNKSRTKA